MISIFNGKNLDGWTPKDEKPEQTTQAKILKTNFPDK
jgi:hypothetical protein